MVSNRTLDSVAAYIRRRLHCAAADAGCCCCCCWAAVGALPTRAPSGLALPSSTHSELTSKIESFLQISQASLVCLCVAFGTVAGRFAGRAVWALLTHTHACGAARRDTHAPAQLADCRRRNHSSLRAKRAGSCCCGICPPPVALERTSSASACSGSKSLQRRLLASWQQIRIHSVCCCVRVSACVYGCLFGWLIENHCKPACVFLFDCLPACPAGRPLHSAFCM